MSLYDQYYSDLNRDYMYGLVKDIIKREYDIDINDEEEKVYFSKKMNEVFNNNNVEEITDINKILLDECVDYMKDKYYKENIVNNVETEDPLQRMIRERESQLDPPKKNDNIFSRINHQSKEVLTDNVISEPISEEKEEEKTDEDILVGIPSSHRISPKSSRYRYSIQLSKEGIDVNKLKIISKLIIPIEDNYLFSIPILLLVIKELNIHLHLQQKDIIQNRYNEVAVYEPIEKIPIQSTDIDKININIMDVSGIEYKNNDILKINLLEIKDDIIIFTCSNINENDYHKNDTIRIINNDVYNLMDHLTQILLNPMKIKYIQNNMIFCKLNLNQRLEEKVYNNIDMNIFNISNQNIIFFNHGF